MYCTKCGTQVPDNSAFCTACGAKLVQPTGSAASQNQSSPQQNNSQASAQQNAPYTYTPNRQQGYSQNGQPVYQNPTPVYQPQDPTMLPMKWYKFLIYFVLFAGAVMDIIAAIAVVTGALYNFQFTAQNGFEYHASTAGLVYHKYQGLQAVDIIYGVLCVADAIFAIYTRFSLSSFKRNGPTCVLIRYALSAAIPLLYTFAVTAITGATAVSSSIVSTVVVATVMIFVNRIYFNKRKALFIN